MTCKFIMMSLTLFCALILVAGCGSSTSPANSSSSTPGQSTFTGSCATSPAPTYSGAAASVFNRKCISCHSQFSTFTGVSADSNSIGTKVSTNSMPPGSGLSSADQATVIQWIACGAKP